MATAWEPWVVAAWVASAVKTLVAGLQIVAKIMARGTPEPEAFAGNLASITPNSMAALAATSSVVAS